MTFEKNVNRLMDFFSSETKIPKNSLHLIGITTDMLDTALQRLTQSKIPLHKAEEIIKKQWSNAEPKARPVTAIEMDYMGFKKEGENWKHNITDTVYTDEQVASLSFKEIEKSILEHPMYEVHQLYKQKFEKDEGV